MRIKTRGCKSRLSKSNPLPSEDDASGEESIPETSSDRHVEPRDDIARDSADEAEVAAEMRCASGTGDIGGGDCMDIDRIEKGTCIKCNSSGQVLICSEIGCPVVLHEKCMGCEPKFDNLGNFFCPYCSYKRAAARMQELRKKAKMAKKALLDFMDSKVGGDVNEKHERAKSKESDISAFARDENDLDHENGLNSNEVENQSGKVVEENQHIERNAAEVADHDQLGGIVPQPETEPVPSFEHGGDDIHHRHEEKTPGIELLKDSITKEKSNEAKICESRQFEIVEDGGRMRAEDPGEVDDSQHEEIEKGQQKPLHVEEEMIVDGGVNVFPKGRPDCIKDLEENQIRTEEEDQMQPEAQKIRDSISEPKVPENVNAVSESSDLDTEASSMNQSHVRKRKRTKSTAQHRISTRKSSSQRDTNGEENARNEIKKDKASKQSTTASSSQIEKGTASKNLGKHQDSAKQISPAIANARCKRKRLLWTTEEEEILKEGVYKFSTKVNKNIPWRKILEFGRHVFDGTRTPGDLRCKWRNILAKESPSIN